MVPLPISSSVRNDATVANIDKILESSFSFTLRLAGVLPSPSSSIRPRPGIADGPAALSPPTPEGPESCEARLRFLGDALVKDDWLGEEAVEEGWELDKPGIELLILRGVGREDDGDGVRSRGSPYTWAIYETVSIAKTMLI